MGVGRLRKIALLGTAQSVDYAPWHDPTWEIWSHASCAERFKRVDRAFEMHPECVWRGPSHKAHYLKWLQRAPYPIYMLEQFPDIPMSVRYPRERLFAECRVMTGGTLHYGSHGDYMIHLALSEGVTHLGLFGMHYVNPVKDGDRLDQLLAIKFWLGVAAGKGVHLVIPDGNPIFSVPKELYGIESHSTLEKYEARLAKENAIAKNPLNRDPFRVAHLSPAEAGNKRRALPPNIDLGHKPDPEMWNKLGEFEAVPV